MSEVKILTATEIEKRWKEYFESDEFKATCKYYEENIRDPLAKMLIDPVLKKMEEFIDEHKLKAFSLRNKQARQYVADLKLKDSDKNIDLIMAYQSGFDCAFEYAQARIEKLEAANKIMLKALKNISSTKKSDLLENPAYWGQMIVGESSQAINQVTKLMGG